MFLYLFFLLWYGLHNDGIKVSLSRDVTFRKAMKNDKQYNSYNIQGQRETHGEIELPLTGGHDVILNRYRTAMP